VHDDPIDIVSAVTGNDDDRHVGSRADVASQIQVALSTKRKIEHHEIHPSCRLRP
jgi:hypothetical protein